MDIIEFGILCWILATPLVTLGSLIYLISQRPHGLYSDYFSFSLIFGSAILALMYMTYSNYSTTYFGIFSFFMLVGVLFTHRIQFLKTLVPNVILSAGIIAFLMPYIKPYLN